MRKFLPFGLVLVLVFYGAMALSHIPKGVTVSDDVSIGRVASLLKASTVPASRYQVSTDRLGRVIVRDASGAIVRTFQMNTIAQVDAAFLLDSGQTVVASQFGKTLFWDLATGKEIQRLNERIYGFSPDQTKFISHNYIENTISLITYPKLQRSCQLLNKQVFPATTFLFSPDSHFLVLNFTISERGGNESAFRNEIEDKGFVYSKLFDLNTCQEMQEFSELFVSGGDRFSVDSRFLYLKDDRVYLNDRDSGRGLWRFDLKTKKVEKFAEASAQNNYYTSESPAPKRPYWVIKDRQGRVSLRNANNGTIVRNFQMDSERVVREIFLLDGGKTLGASQNDYTVFWDLATGREIRRFPLRIYGFSHDETKFITWGQGKRMGELPLYSYPDMKLICKLSDYTVGGIVNFHFSADDRFLLIWFSTAQPASDENYPYGDLASPGFGDINLFNIQSCQEVQEFSQVIGLRTAEFSADSRLLYLRDAARDTNRGLLAGEWRFNLTTYQFEEIDQ